jgi:putative glutathione S-transferase
MAQTSKPFSLGAEQGGDGTFQRQVSAFRNRVSSDGSTPFPAVAGRYHLYVSWACPWAHRTIIARKLKGLESVIGMSVVDPIRDERGWAFTGGPFVDPLHGWELLADAYDATDPDFAGRYSVPVLWDTETGRIVNNESGDILRMLDEAFGDLADRRVVLAPPELRADIDALNERVYDNLNNAVYQAGFTTSQAAYEDAATRVYDQLVELDGRLADRRYLFGEEPTETDWRVFTTLVRFDTIYAVHFKCSLARVVDFPNLWPYLRDLYQRPGIAETVKLDQIRAHYYGTHPQINPSGLVALIPRTLDLDAPHGRERRVERVVEERDLGAERAG